MKVLLLIRHAESEKNVSGRFDSRRREDLTGKGRAAALAMAQDLKALESILLGYELALYSGCSIRALDTAGAIGKVLGLPIRETEVLRSIEMPGLSGMRESDLVASNSQVYQAVQLYRAGLLNSYSIPGVRERSLEFELTIMAWLREVVANMKQQSVALVIGHRSSITAMSIGLARLGHDYPEEFYGYVALDLCHGICALVGAGLSATTPPEVICSNQNIPEILARLRSRLGNSSSYQ